MNITLAIFNLLIIAIGIRHGKVKGFFISMFVLAVSNMLISGILSLFGAIITIILLVIVIFFQIVMLFADSSKGDTYTMPQSNFSRNTSVSSDDSEQEESNENQGTQTATAEEYVDTTGPSGSSAYDPKIGKPIQMGVFGSVKGDIKKACRTSRYNISVGKSYKIHDHVYDESKFSCPHFYYIKDNNGSFVWVESDCF
jgi:hypothetical protein